MHVRFTEERWRAGQRPSAAPRARLSRCTVLGGKRLPALCVRASAIPAVFVGNDTSRRAPHNVHLHKKGRSELCFPVVLGIYGIPVIDPRVPRAVDDASDKVH